MLGSYEVTAVTESSSLGERGQQKADREGSSILNTMKQHHQQQSQARLYLDREEPRNVGEMGKE